LQKGRHVFRGVFWIDNDMDVLRHDNVGPKLIGKLPARFIESLAEPLTRPVSPEKWIVTIARKCQFARLPRFVETDATFPHVTLAGLRIDHAHTGAR